MSAQRGYVPEDPRRLDEFYKKIERQAKRIELAAPLNENWPPRKEQAPCCIAKRLPDGRPVLGFCSPECIRRPANWRRYVRARRRR